MRRRETLYLACELVGSYDVLALAENRQTDMTRTGDGCQSIACYTAHAANQPPITQCVFLNLLRAAYIKRIMLWREIVLGRKRLSGND